MNLSGNLRATVNVESDTLDSACGLEPSWLCRQVFELTDSAGAASLIGWIVERPLKILLILVLAWIVRRVTHRGIERLVERLVSDRNLEEKNETQGAAAAAISQVVAKRLQHLQERSERARQRARTLGALFKSGASATIGAVAIIMVLGEFDVNLGPLIAGAGILGVAIGFGAQSVVRDLLTGIFMLIEDQYGVGDVINTGEATGTVESVGLRTTRVRDIEGTLWHVPNGVISRVGNLTQGWSRTVLDIDVSYDTNLDEAMELIKRVADELWHEQLESSTIVEEPTLSGVQNLGADGIAIRLVAKTDPAEQWSTARELRKRIKNAMDEAGIEIPFPQRTVWLRHEGGDARAEPEQLK